MVREDLGEQVTSDLSPEKQEGASPEMLWGLHIPSRGIYRCRHPETARSLMLEEEKKDGYGARRWAARGRLWVAGYRSRGSCWQHSSGLADQTTGMNFIPSAQGLSLV